MSDTTTHLQLPLLAAAQAQKHITVNESLLRLDALVPKTASLAAEPGAPADGDLTYCRRARLAPIGAP